MSKHDSSPRGKRKRGEKRARGKSPGSSGGRKKKSPKAVESWVENEDSISRTHADNIEEISRDSKHSDTRRYFASFAFKL